MVYIAYCGRTFPPCPPYTHVNVILSIWTLPFFVSHHYYSHWHRTQITPHNRRDEQYDQLSLGYPPPPKKKNLPRPHFSGREMVGWSLKKKQLPTHRGSLGTFIRVHITILGMGCNVLKVVTMGALDRVLMSHVDFKKYTCRPDESKKCSCCPVNTKKFPCPIMSLFVQISCRMSLRPKTPHVALSIFFFFFFFFFLCFISEHIQDLSWSS